MPFVKNKMELDLVLVYLNFMEIHMKVVDLNVLWMQNVNPIKHVWPTNAKIHVLEHVAKTLTVKLLTIYQHAHVLMVTREIHSVTVIQYLYNVIFNSTQYCSCYFRLNFIHFLIFIYVQILKYNQFIHARHRHVDLIVNVGK